MARELVLRRRLEAECWVGTSIRRAIIGRRIISFRVRAKIKWKLIGNVGAKKVCRLTSRQYRETIWIPGRSSLTIS